MFFWQLLGKFGLLLIPTSGHTDGGSSLGVRCLSYLLLLDFYEGATSLKILGRHWAQVKLATKNCLLSKGSFRLPTAILLQQATNAVCCD